MNALSPEDSIAVRPVPGVCFKTSNSDNGDKVFINLCTSTQVPVGPPISDEELLAHLQRIADGEAEKVGYRVPMSIGPPHLETDAHEKACAVYDVIINPALLARAERSDLWLGFMMGIIFEGIELKHSCTLDRKNYRRMKNRKAMGTLGEQYIRRGPKRGPLVTELPDRNSAARAAAEASTYPKSSSKSRGPAPNFRVLRMQPLPQYPPFTENGDPRPTREYLLFEIHLPQVMTSSAITLEVNEEKLVLDTRSGAHSLELKLPADAHIEAQQATARFDSDTRVLRVRAELKR